MCQHAASSADGKENQQASHISAKLQLPMSSMIEELKVSICLLVMTQNNSKDAENSEIGVQTRTYRKWSTRQAVQQAEDGATL